MRVHELAKKLGVSNKDVMAKLAEIGIKVTSHMNALPEDAEARIMEQTQPAAPPATSAQPVPGRAAKADAAKTPAPPPEKTALSPSKPPLKDQCPATGQAPRPSAPERIIILRGSIVVKELAEKMGMKPNQVITDLMAMNVLASINERVDFKAAQRIAEKHGFVLQHEKKTAEQKPSVRTMEDDETEEDLLEDLEPRPPIVTFLGHIDHGKTSLLDRIRKSSVAKNEPGGITQHIGAYTISHNGRSITFLDTPGHEAFTAMRARGANLTDIAVLVIAADDGVMPQTREAIKHAQAANTSIIVAINKIDLPGARPQNVMTQLQAIGLTPEEWGGNVICCQVSAITGKGIDELLEMILLQAEMLELKANHKAKAQGYVIESQMEPGVGPVAHMMVMRGVLRIGDAVACGAYWGRVKALTNDHGVKVRTAGPATPIKCMGLSGVPLAGEKFRVYSTDKAARAVAESRSENLRAEKFAVPKKASLDELFNRLNAGQALELRLVLKCDTQGSLEAIRQALVDINSEKVTVSIILGGVGNITANDVLLASASDAVVVGFNVGKESGVPALEKREGVEVRLYAIIYDILDEIKKAMSGMLAPQLREKPVGVAVVRQVFDISKKGKIAGCMVTSGRADARCKARVRRVSEIIYEGMVVTLKRFQDTVNEVREGMECGVRLDNFSAFEPADEIEFFEIEEIPQEL